jgi:ankyrin repeat protein
MKVLLKAGAAPSRAGFNRVTPLYTAVVYGNAEVIGLLLEFGAAKDATDTLGETLYD